MYKAMDGMRNDAVERDRVNNSKKMIEFGKLSLEDIALFPSLPLEKVRELAGEKTA